MLLFSSFCLLSLFSLALGAPAPLTEMDQKILLVWGKDINLERVHTILEEEASKLSLTAEEYFNGCTADINEAALTEQETADIKEEARTAAPLGAIRFESREEVMQTLEKKFPKAYKAIVKRLALIQKYIEQLDEQSQEFARNVGNSILDSIVELTQSTAAVSSENPMEILMKMGKTLKKIVVQYQALPQSSKDNIERKFCSRASMRITGQGEKAKAMIGMLTTLAEI